jgi:hypothetical protein
MRYVLGVEIVEPGFKAIRVRPNLGPLEWAKGVIPTMHGDIEIKVVKKDNKDCVELLNIPVGVKVTDD